MKIKTVGKGEWHIVRIPPQKILEMASELYKDIEKGDTPTYMCYWNQTEDDNFRIEVCN